MGSVHHMLSLQRNYQRRTPRTLSLLQHGIPPMADSPPELLQHEEGNPASPWSTSQAAGKSFFQHLEDLLTPILHWPQCLQSYSLTYSHSCPSHLLHRYGTTISDGLGDSDRSLLELQAAVPDTGTTSDSLSEKQHLQPSPLATKTLPYNPNIGRKKKNSIADSWNNKTSGVLQVALTLTKSALPNRLIISLLSLQYLGWYDSKL